MILVLFILAPFTTSNTLSLFYAFRVTQTRVMLLSIIHGLKPNVKLKAVLEGCAGLDRLFLAGVTCFVFQRFLPSQLGTGVTCAP